MALEGDIFLTFPGPVLYFCYTLHVHERVVLLNIFYTDIFEMYISLPDYDPRLILAIHPLELLGHLLSCSKMSILRNIIFSITSSPVSVFPCVPN